MATSENPGQSEADAALLRDATQKWDKGFEDGQKGVNNDDKWDSTQYQEGQIAGSRYPGTSTEQ